MCCRISDLRQKQVVCIKSGTLLGTVGDVEIDTLHGSILSIVILGRPKFFGLFGRYEDVVLPWGCIEVIGRDAMLVNFEPNNTRPRKNGFFNNFLGGKYMN